MTTNLKLDNSMQQLQAIILALKLSTPEVLLATLSHTQMAS